MMFGFDTVIVESCIEPKNPLPERVLKRGDKKVTRILHFSNQWLADLELVAELTTR
jgi:hypothetical protein